MGRYGSGGRWSSSCWRRVMVGLRGRRSKRGWLLQLGGLTPSLESPDSDTVLPACTDYRYGSVTRYGPTRTPSNSHNTRRAPRRPHYFRDDLDLAGHSSTSSLSCSASPTLTNGDHPYPICCGGNGAYKYPPGAFGSA